ncbi:hypothetical protein DL768_002768 [Monosporascus sp. mg162]|nr:hypothetical protein DL768_002768 [Monosporascus sp. mg162]
MNFVSVKSAVLQLQKPTVLQQSSTGFYMSISQPFNAFANAGTLVVAPSRIRGDPLLIAQLMLEQNVELTIATPTEYFLLAMYAADALRHTSSWKHACSGGETVSRELVSLMARLDVEGLQFTDWYGPTEASCAATFRAVSLSDGSGLNRVSVYGLVGSPIGNTRVSILGNDGQPLPVGFLGEIAIAGPGLAEGYIDQSQSTGSFATDSFASADDTALGWNRIYKTGDRGYLRADGQLMFLGRLESDTVIKIRGLRLDLQEVSIAILQAAKGALADAVVTVRGQPEFLVAHVVPVQESGLDEAALKALREDLPLPRYMVPSMIIPLDRLPTTPNGKIDRRAVQELLLPAIHENSSAKASNTVVEEELRIMWKDILGEAAGGSSIGHDTDFFMVGGSSLLLVRLQNVLRDRTGVRIPLQDFYRASTLRKMAASVAMREAGFLLKTSTGPQRLRFLRTFSQLLKIYPSPSPAITNVRLSSLAELASWAQRSSGNY